MSHVPHNLLVQDRKSPWGYCLILSVTILGHILASENVLAVPDSKKPRNTNTTTTTIKDDHLSSLSVRRHCAGHFACIFSCKAPQPASEVRVVTMPIFDREKLRLRKVEFPARCT